MVHSTHLFTFCIIRFLPPLTVFYWGAPVNVHIRTYVCLCVCVVSCRTSAKVVSDREMQRKASHNEGWLVVDWVTLPLFLVKSIWNAFVRSLNQSFLLCLCWLWRIACFCFCTYIRTYMFNIGMYVRSCLRRVCVSVSNKGMYLFNKGALIRPWPWGPWDAWS